jgi:hypothetical protein
LYDQAYLDANCDSAVVPLNVDNGVDSSIATFSTNYVIAVITLFFATIVLLHALKNDKECTGKFMSLYLASTGVAFGLGGIGHQFSEEKEELLNRILLPIVSFFGNVGTYSLLYVVLVSHLKVEGILRAAWALMATALTVYGSAVALYDPNPTGIPGFIVILSALVTQARQMWRFRKIAIALKLCGFVSMVIGGIVQLSLSSVCGFDGYPECFRRCPLPAPEFNHNALFHILAIVFYVLYGVGEWKLPAQECLWILRKPVGGHDGNSSARDEEKSSDEKTC